MAFSVEDYFAQEMSRMSGGSKNSYWGTSFSGGFGTIAGGPRKAPPKGGAPDGGTSPPKAPPKAPAQDFTPSQDYSSAGPRKGPSETPLPNYDAHEGQFQYSYEGWNTDGAYCNGTFGYVSQSPDHIFVSGYLPPCGPGATYGRKPPKKSKPPKGQDTGVNKGAHASNDTSHKDMSQIFKASWDWF